MASWNQWHSDDPFSSSNGGIPRFYASRPEIAEPVAQFIGRLEAGRFAPGIALVGARGSGKTVELYRLGDALLTAGIVPVHLNLSRATRPGVNMLAMLLLEALRQAAAAPVPRAQGKTTVSATLKAPLLPLELGVSHELARSDPQLVEELDRLIQELSAPNGLVFLVDEGDLLDDAEFEGYLLDPIAEAASSDLPVSIVTSGTSMRYLRAVTGKTLSYAPRLVPPLMIPRLHREASRQLLVETAATGGQIWDGDWVYVLADASTGLPRSLHAIGRQMFGEVANGSVPESSVEKIVDHQRAIASHMRHATLNEAWEDARTVAAWAPSGVDWYDLVRDLAAHSHYTFEESQGRMDRILTSGLIEVDSEWRVFLVEEI